MKGTYQPFIHNLVDEVFEILNEELNPTDKNKEELCKMLTQKFIDGELDESTKVDSTFNSEEEVLQFINLCMVNDDLEILRGKGLVGTYNDGETYFITQEGNEYVKKNILGR